MRVHITALVNASTTAFAMLVVTVGHHYRVPITGGWLYHTPDNK